jgi:hypothetical protein
MTTISHGKKVLMESGHLVTSLKLKIGDGQASSAIGTLEEMQVAGVRFEALLHVQMEQLEEREKRDREDMGRTEKRISIEEQLNNLGYENSLAELRREYDQQQDSLSELTRRREGLEEYLEWAGTVCYKMSLLRGRLKLFTWVPQRIMRVFRSKALLLDAADIEGEWGAVLTRE